MTLIKTNGHQQKTKLKNKMNPEIYFICLGITLIIMMVINYYMNNKSK
jgi:hypothetical protein